MELDFYVVTRPRSDVTTIYAALEYFAFPKL